MLRSRQREDTVSVASGSISSDFAPLRLAAILAIVLVLSKAFSLDRSLSYRWLLDLSMASYRDVLFALGLGATATVAIKAVSARSSLTDFRHAFVTLCVLCAFYSVVAAGVFNYFRRPLNYDLLRLMYGVGAVESSVRERLTLPIALALVGVPAGYYALTRGVVWKQRTTAFLIAMLLAWSAFGWWQYHQGSRSSFMLHLSVNPHIELVRSAWNGMTGLGKPSLPLAYPREYLEDFQPRSGRPTVEWGKSTLAVEAPPKNVIVIVLESVGTKYLSLYGSKYDTTPTLQKEAAHALVFDNFYAHVPYTFCSFMALNFSIYPGLPWCYAPARTRAARALGNTFSLNGQRPLPQTLASVLKQRGTRTAYLCNGDLKWGGIDDVLKNQGYDSIEDYRAMGGSPLSSWGAGDPVLFDRLISFIDEKPGQPFYAFCWTDQTHDPYVLGPGQETFDFFGEQAPARHAADLGRYLNVLRQADRLLGNLFQALRDRGLADETLVVITGDHGEAFGDPHDQRGHGYTAYQEDVNVPLILWNPRLFPSGQRLKTIGGHVDLGATIADLLNVPFPADWQGYSMFDPGRPQRAYYLASIGEYLFGVREGKWKYTFEATSGREFLTDLATDPHELKNLARSEPAICRELRSRVAAWVDFEDKFMRPNGKVIAKNPDNFNQSTPH